IMRIVVMGAGSVGSYIVSILTDEGHDVLVVEQDPDVLNYVLAENDVMGILGDGTDPDLLREAEIKDADFFISLADDDEVNIVAGNMAKVLGAKFTIARVRSPKYQKNNEFMKTFMGIDYFLNPERLSAISIELTLGYAMASSVESFFHDKVEMIQFEIREDSLMANKTLSDITKYGLLNKVLITIVDRDKKIFIPGGSFKIMPHDNVHVVGTPYDLRQLYLREFGSKTDIKSTLIIGASRISYYLAENILQKGYDVKVIEVDENKARKFHHMLQKAVVIHGDGANSTFLAEENFEDYDSAIALTGIDERNILIGLLAQKAGIPEVITRVDNKDLLRVTGVLDIDITVTPIKEAANHILKVIRSKENANEFSISSLYLLEDNEVEAVEFLVLKGSKVIGKTLNSLKIKSDTLIAFLYRAKTGEIIAPNGETILEVNDQVIVITKMKAFEDIDDILEGE
ncbi:MAG: Trk system potassium transporter TrkA, partial [Anaerococcus sp.]|nr:Trk system potassium transporter TrkA [Anaerococcus sp.]